MASFRYPKMLVMAIWIACLTSDLPAVRADDSVRYSNDFKIEP